MVVNRGLNVFFLLSIMINLKETLLDSERDVNVWTQLWRFIQTQIMPIHNLLPTPIPHPQKEKNEAKRKIKKQVADLADRKRQKPGQKDESVTFAASWQVAAKGASERATSEEFGVD